MRRVGLEPTRLATQEPKSCLSANSNIGAYHIHKTRLLRSRNRDPAFAIRAAALLAHAGQVF